MTYNFHSSLPVDVPNNSNKSAYSEWKRIHTHKNIERRNMFLLFSLNEMHQW